MPREDPSSLHDELSVDEVLTRWPATVQVFIRRRMHCVGCAVARFETIAEACRIYGQPLDAVLGELRTAASGRGERREGARAWR